MNSHKNYKELGLLQDFFRKNHKATFNCDQNKVEITSSDITPLLVKGKSNFQQAKFYFIRTGDAFTVSTFMVCYFAGTER